MGELSDYIMYLRHVGARVGFREMRSRFLRENPKKAVNRLLSFLNEFAIPYTFCVVGLTAEKNLPIMEDILSNGHEIACHGYFHTHFDRMSKDEIRKDLSMFKELFLKHFGFEVVGFRAPQLRINDLVIEILGELGFIYSSSVELEAGGSGLQALNSKPYRYENGILELPVTVDDWHILIKKGIAHPHLFVNYLKEAHHENANYLLHPWRIGQKKYIEALKPFILGNKYQWVTLSQMASGKSGCSLNGDLGEFGITEIICRVLRW